MQKQASAYINSMQRIPMVRFCFGSTKQIFDFYILFSHRCGPYSMHSDTQIEIYVVS